jgi:hypothetical protein
MQLRPAIETIGRGTLGVGGAVAELGRVAYGAFAGTLRRGRPRGEVVRPM